MADKGIIFSAPMVLALLDGRKTQTRRLFKDAPKGDWHCDRSAVGLRWVAGPGFPSMPCRVPYAVGDRLYVREAWSVRGAYTDVVEVGYRASENRGHTEYVGHIPVTKAVPGKGKWPSFPNYGPSIHMPRWASRLWLAVTDVWVQRLQDCGEDDAIAEGIERSPHGNGDQWLDYPAGSSAAGWLDPRESYRSLWNSLHIAEGSTWDANPWAVAVSFDVHRGNIDQVQA